MLIPAGFGQANLKFQSAATPHGAEVTFGFERVGVGDPLTVGGIIRDAWDDELIDNLLSDQIELVSILVKFGPNDTGPAQELAVSLPGLDSGTPVPPNVSVLVHKHTAFGGRQGRGRMYIPGIPEGQVDGAGTITSATPAVWTTRFNNFLGVLEAADYPMVLLHAGSGAVTTPYPVIGLTCSSTVATQRRRLRP